jgi:hypothetical protein
MVVGTGRGHVKGLLGPYGEEFRARLLASGYTWGSAVRQVHLMAHFSRWVGENELSLGEIDRGTVQAFLESRRGTGYVSYLSERGIAPMLAYLRDVGLVPLETLPRPTPVGALLEEFERYLIDERGLGADSVRSYVGVAGQFAAHLGGEVLDHHVLDPRAVTGFVREECGRRGPGSASATVTGTRAFLRFLHARQMTPISLVASVPSVTGWSLASLPRAIAPAELRRLLRSRDRRSPVGRRDFAIVTPCSRLGLRAGEVARLELGDIDWRRGEVVVSGKGGTASTRCLSQKTSGSFLAVDADHAVARLKPCRGDLVELGELAVTVGVGGALVLFGGGLQAEAHLVQEPPDELGRD